MIVINTNRHNGTRKGVNIFFAAPILSGKHKGKFATSENSFNEFPEIFKYEPYEVVELDAKAFELDFAPPTLTGKKVAIPEKWEALFPEDKFILGGFVIELERIEGVLAVDIAYLGWTAFQEEVNKPEHAAINRHMGKIWEHCKEQINKGNFV